MKRIVQVLMLVFLMSGSHALLAQQQLTEEEREAAIEKYLEFQEELNLSEAQKPKVDEINKSYFQSLKELRTSNASRLQKYRSFKELSASRDQKMKNVLTKEQYKSYKDFQEETREALRKRRKNQR